MNYHKKNYNMLFNNEFYYIITWGSLRANNISIILYYIILMVCNTHDVLINYYTGNVLWLRMIRCRGDFEKQIILD